MKHNYQLRSIVADLAHQQNSADTFTNFQVSTSAIRATLPILGSSIAVRAFEDDEGYTVGYTPLNAAAMKWLNDIFVTRAVIRYDPAGHSLHSIKSKVPIENLSREIVRAADVALKLRKQEEAADYSPEQAVHMHWFAPKLNFGDWIGPQLVNNYTGRQPVQSDRNVAGSRLLFAVGSILTLVNRNNVDIWGSGLMRPLTPTESEIKSRLQGIKVHAVRGKLTQRELLRSTPWHVPDVFGDPGLLVPDMVDAPSFAHNNVAVVPHYVHLPHVDRSRSSGRIVDVRSDVKSVSEQIAGASAVVSSSLHGLIVAQAFEVPWVWLDVSDHKLGGGDFKFDDFFSCLDSAAVRKISVTKEELKNLDPAELGRQAWLPELRIDVDALRDSMPVPMIDRPISNEHQCDLVEV